MFCASFGCYKYYIPITFLKRFYVFIFRERGRAGERETEKHPCVVSSHTPNRGPGPQPSHVPWQGIQPATLWFAGRRSIHWATPARDILITLNKKAFYLTVLQDEQFNTKVPADSVFPVLHHHPYVTQRETERKRDVACVPLLQGYLLIPLWVPTLPTLSNPNHLPKLHPQTHHIRG